jgi:phenylalanine-4-hydroxylase
VKVSGILRSKIRYEGKWVVFTFTDCSISYEGKILYEPSWGPYDMAVGEKIVSCFSGPADPAAFGLSFPVPSEKTHKILHTEKAKQLFALYQEVRDIRANKASLSLLSPIWVKLKNNYPDDWLCALEIMELSTGNKEGLLYRETMTFLENKKSESEAVKKLVEDGFAMLDAER